MTKNTKFKRQVRARAAKTGESYTAALTHLRRSPAHLSASGTRTVRLAIAQTLACEDPGNIDQLRQSGIAIRDMLRQAHAAGARLVHFPEGAICAPGKRILSQSGPAEIGPSDWTRANWTILHEELDATRQLARELELWAVLGSIHKLSKPHRPHNSLYVISDRGELVTRYDERMLSHTKISHMYTPGSVPIIFVVDGICFGCALGMELHFPEIFIEYERLNVDCVLFSTTGGSVSDGTFTAEALGHAASNNFWISVSAHWQDGLSEPSGLAKPSGQWAHNCPGDGHPNFIVADITAATQDPARPWRRLARSGIYDQYRADDDPRSRERTIV